MQFVCVCVCVCVHVCVCFGFWLPSLRGTHTKTNTYHPNLAATKGALERGGDTISRAPLRRGNLGAVTIHFKHTSTLVRGCVQILSTRKILFKYRIHSQHHNTYTHSQNVHYNFCSFSVKVDCRVRGESTSKDSPGKLTLRGPKKSTSKLLGLKLTC